MASRAISVGTPEYDPIYKTHNLHSVGIESVMAIASI